jgi:glutathione S-transferase
MSQVTIYGPPQSSYVRTARLVCEEKGVAYELAPVKFGGDEHLAMHPFGRVPIFTHGDVRLVETSAIARYVDEVFPGPSLVPATAIERARMEQWISMVNSYLYEDIIKKYVLAYIFPKTEDKSPDRALIAAALPNLQRDLEIVDRAVGEHPWLAGKSLSLADLFLCPILASASMFPEAKEIMGRLENLPRAGAAMMSRPSVAKTAPPMPGR